MNISRQSTLHRIPHTLPHGFMPELSSDMATGRGLETPSTPVHFTVLDAAMHPVRGATITAEFTTQGEHRTVEAVSDARGHCVLVAPLTLKRNIREWRLEGRVVRICTAEGVSTEFRSAPIAAWFFNGELRDQYRRLYLEEGVARLSACHRVPSVTQVQAMVSAAPDETAQRAVLSTLPSHTLWAQATHFSSTGHVRAFVDALGSPTRYEVCCRAVYYSESPFDFHQVRYRSESGDMSATLTPLGHQEQVESFLGTCHIEELAFPIPEALVRWIAGQHLEGSDRTWSFHLLGKSGAGRKMSIPCFEFAGLIARVRDGVSSEPSRTH